MEPKFINHGKERRFQSYNIAVCSCGKRNQKCWSSNAIAVISKMLQQELPGLRGYSEASIKMMRIFYEEWCILFENRQLAIDDFNNNLANKILDNKITVNKFST